MDFTLIVTGIVIIFLDYLLFLPGNGEILFKSFGTSDKLTIDLYTCGHACLHVNKLYCEHECMEAEVGMVKSTFN
jgi:hypothetical protein